MGYNPLIKSALDSNTAPAPGGFRHAVGALASEPGRVELRAGQQAWTLDEPKALGGHGAAPDPITAFLGSLCGCLLMSLEITARARQVPLAGASVSARSNTKGFVKTIDVDVTVRSAASEETVRTVVARAEKGCYVRGLLKDSIAYSLHVSVLPA